LNSNTLEGLIQLTGDERFAWDAYRRFVQMFGEIVLGAPKEKLDRAMEQLKAGVSLSWGRALCLGRSYRIVG